MRREEAQTGTAESDDVTHPRRRTEYSGENIAENRDHAQSENSAGSGAVVLVFAIHDRGVQLDYHLVAAFPCIARQFPCSAGVRGDLERYSQAANSQSREIAKLVLGTQPIAAE
jgi:hypothetical protein